MTRARALLLLALLTPLAAAACEQKFYPPAEESKISGAEEFYSPEAFDTLHWSSAQQRIEAGNMVFALKCRRCHGPIGRGNTEYDRDHDLHPPSLVTPEFAYDSLPALRRVIFTGHLGGMPSFGIRELTPREIDAVAYYILAELRPEILSGKTHLPGPLEVPPGQSR